jgi:prepilin-type N-terminal cleavage/methylation domain-containing protein
MSGDMDKETKAKIQGHQGFALMEVLVSLTLASVAAISVSLSLATSLRVAKLTEVHFAASTLASGKMEELAALDPLDLDPSDNSTETSVTFPELSLTFTRQVTVTVNSDDSRTINVQVSSNSSAIPTVVAFETTFALWE